MKASELQAALQRMIDAYGDQEVYAGGTDYPEEVSGVALTRENAYTPGDKFEVY